MSVCFVCVTERWIRERTQLQHQCLAHVKCLSLPGVYNCKISQLGRSLHNFVRLKKLDLSCNALVSVQGIQHVQTLEELNLYYNRISSLSDVLLLCSLQKLTRLDLRLNPVVNHNPQYRVYMVHAISSLRVLDEYVVRDIERKVSIMQFPSERVCDHQQADGSSEIKTLPRLAFVRKTLRRCMHDSIEAVLNEKPGVRRSNKYETQLYDLQDRLINPSHNKRRSVPRVTFVTPVFDERLIHPQHAKQKKTNQHCKTATQVSFTPTPGEEMHWQ